MRSPLLLIIKLFNIVKDIGLDFGASSMATSVHPFSFQQPKETFGERPPFDAVLIFKILVLQALYNLSDDQTEYQIRNRLSFMRFLWLNLDQRIPDAKAIWLFHETIV